MDNNRPTAGRAVNVARDRSVIKISYEYACVLYIVYAARLVRQAHLSTTILISSHRRELANSSQTICDISDSKNEISIYFYDFVYKL